jgi:hypothetical protein
MNELALAERSVVKNRRQCGQRLRNQLPQGCRRPRKLHRRNGIPTWALKGLHLPCPDCRAPLEKRLGMSAAGRKQKSRWVMLFSSGDAA